MRSHLKARIAVVLLVLCCAAVAVVLVSSRSDKSAAPITHSSVYKARPDEGLAPIRQRSTEHAYSARPDEGLAPIR